MERGRRSTETVRLDSGLPPAAASPTRPRTSPRPNRGGRASAYRLFGGFCDEPSSSPPEAHSPNAATLAPTRRGGQDRLEPKPGRSRGADREFVACDHLRDSFWRKTPSVKRLVLRVI